MHKRGLSPIIATMLLISLGLVLGVIVFLWAKSFIGESLTKEGSNVDILCPDVSFDAEAYDGKIYIANRGTVAIYGVEVRRQAVFGEVIAVQTQPSGFTILPGESGSFDLPTDVNNGEEIILIPVLLPENKRSERKTHVCDEKYGSEVKVQ